MRKRSAYRPKGVILDVMGWLKQGMVPLRQTGDAALTLKIKNHLAMEELRLGRGGYDDVDVVIAALNMTEALSRLRIGNQFASAICAGQDALLTMAQRGLKLDRFVFTGPELAAVNLAMAVHDAQLDACTVAELEKALGIVQKEIRAKKARVIQLEEA